VNATDLQNATAEDILAWTYRRFGRVALVASFQAESMVLIDLACKIVPAPEVLTLDTGRLHEETHDYIEYVREQFPIRLRILAPESNELEAMTSEHGDMLFRKSVGLRNQCCAVRKVNPLARALQDYDAWITGLRRDQTPTRAATVSRSVRCLTITLIVSVNVALSMSCAPSSSSARAQSIDSAMLGGFLRSSSRTCCTISTNLRATVSSSSGECRRTISSSCSSSG